MDGGGKVVADLEFLAGLVVQIGIGRIRYQLCLQQWQVAFFLVGIERMLQIAIMP